MTRARGAGTLTSISKPSKIATTRAIRNANTGLSRTPAVMIGNCAQAGRVLIMAMSTWYLTMPITSADRFSAVAPFGIAQTAAFEPPGWRARMKAATVR
jgi:hypothetical protein